MKVLRRSEVIGIPPHYLAVLSYLDRIPHTTVCNENIVTRSVSEGKRHLSIHPTLKMWPSSHVCCLSNPAQRDYTVLSDVAGRFRCAESALSSISLSSRNFFHAVASSPLTPEI